MCVCRVLPGGRASSGAAPALEDPSESLVAEGPAEDELEMGTVFAILAVSMTRISTLQRTAWLLQLTASANASAMY